MSTTEISLEIERIKKLVNEDLVLSAVELPTPRKNRLLAEIEQILSEFEREEDADPDTSYFILRARRSLQESKNETCVTEHVEKALDQLVNETLELSADLKQKELGAKEVETAQPAVAEEQGCASEHYDGDEIFENARVLEEAKDYVLARKMYRLLIQNGNKIPESLHALGRTYEAENSFEKALKYFQEAIVYASEASYYQSIAATQVKIGQDDAACRTIHLALTLKGISDAQKFDLYKLQGNCLTRLSKLQEAETAYSKAYDLNPLSDALQVNLGSLSLQKNDYPSATEHFQKAIELNPQNDKALSGLGMAALYKQNPQEAYHYFYKSVEANLENLVALFNLVKCAYELKQFKQTALILERYLEKYPDNLNILYSYAGILFHLGDYSQSLAQVEKLLNLKKDHVGGNELKELIERRIH